MARDISISLKMFPTKQCRIPISLSYEDMGLGGNAMNNTLFLFEGLLYKSKK